MTAEGHLFFSIACAVFAKNAELTPVLAQGDWWHIVPSAVLTCLLPDIDHPKSFLGQRLSWISKPVARAFGHRGFTHSLLAVFGALTLFYLKVPDSWIVPADALQGWCWAISATFSPICSPPPVCRCCGPVAGAFGCRSLRRARAISSNAPCVWHCSSMPSGCRRRWRITARYAGHPG